MVGAGIIGGGIQIAKGIQKQSNAVTDVIDTYKSLNPYLIINSFEFASLSNCFDGLFKIDEYGNIN